MSGSFVVNIHCDGTIIIIIIIIIIIWNYSLHTKSQNM